MTISETQDPVAWDAFLGSQPFRPFLQSWTMGEVYREIGQPPVRLTIEEQGKIQGICFAHVVDAKRGRHLSVPYGPVLASGQRAAGSGQQLLAHLIDELKRIACAEKCSFIRMSPFWPNQFSIFNFQFSISSPLHLLAEQIWYIPLITPDPWNHQLPVAGGEPRQWRATSCQLPARLEDDILMHMRKTTRNLIRRAERDGVEVIASTDPMRDVETFIALHSETRKRHGFTPYTSTLFRSQVKHFASENRCTVYLAKHQNQTLAASIHMHTFGETSYHHGASVQSKIPASYLLQWRAIKDALRRGDHVYNLWGIAPFSPTPNPSPDGGGAPLSPFGGKGSGDRGKSHPFSGVTLFKTGFGGNLLPLIHCFDIPIKPTYWLTYGFETVRKWRRGF